MEFGVSMHFKMLEAVRRYADGTTFSAHLIHLNGSTHLTDPATLALRFPQIPPQRCATIEPAWQNQEVNH